MQMIEFLTNYEERLTSEIKALQKERREIRSGLMRLKGQELNPVPEKSSGGNNRVCLCARPDLHGCHCGALD